MLRTLFILLYAIGLTGSLLVLGACSGIGIETAHPVQLQVLNKSSRSVSFCFASEFPRCESVIAPGGFGGGTIFVNKIMTKDEVMRLFDEQTLLICGAHIPIRAIRAVVPTFEILKGVRYQIEIYDSTQDLFCKDNTMSKLHSTPA